MCRSPPPGFAALLVALLLVARPGGARAVSHAVNSSNGTAAVGPSASGPDELPLLTALKNSGPGLAASTYVFLGLAVLTNVDPAPLIWHAQWVTFGPWLEGYAGNSSIVWTSTTPPTGGNPDGVEFHYERWSSNFWPLALNFTWTENMGLVDDLATQFASCTVVDFTFDLNVTEDATRNTSNSTAGSGGRLLRRRRLNVPNIESCSFKDRRHLKRAATFINVSITYLIGIAVAGVIQLLAWVLSKKRWEAYLGGTFWLKTEQDLERANPLTFFHVPLTAPRLFLSYFTYVAWQPMVFASCNAIATGSSGVSTFVAPGVISLILFILVPLAGIKRFIDKKIVKHGQHSLPGQQTVYIKDMRGWRDVKDGQFHHSWRKSPFTAGYGLLFGSYKSKWRAWLPIWLLMQLMICLWMTQMIPVPAKIQAIVIMALYFMYFIVVLFMRPFISMGTWFIHLAVVFHNGVCTVFTQFTDEQGLFNMEVAEDIASKGVQGATENDGILIAMGTGGLVTLFVYVVLRIVFKVLGLRNPTEAQIKEDSEEFYSTSKRRSSLQGRPRLATEERALDARNSSWDRTKSMAGGGSMLAHILGMQTDADGEGSGGGGDNEKEQELMVNPMKARALSMNLVTATDKEEKKEVKKAAGLSLKAAAKVVTASKTMAEPLPDGWREVEDPGSGKTYYHHRLTSQTQWTRPDGASKPAAALPDGWDEVKDPSSGRVYFHNRHTSATQWTRP